MLRLCVYPSFHPFHYLLRLQLVDSAAIYVVSTAVDQHFGLCNLRRIFVYANGDDGDTADQWAFEGFGYIIV